MLRRHAFAVLLVLSSIAPLLLANPCNTSNFGQSNRNRHRVSHVQKVVRLPYGFRVEDGLAPTSERVSVPDLRDRPSNAC